MKSYINYSLLSSSIILLMLIGACKDKDDAPNDKYIKGLPTVVTIGTDSLGQNYASIKSKIITEGDHVVTERGIVWTTDQNSLPPTINHNKIIMGAGVGEYICEMDSIEVGFRYYVRAYATNKLGTAYGETISFESPVVVNGRYKGGYVGYIFQLGDSMYVPGEIHGIVFYKTDVYNWGCNGMEVGNVNNKIGGGMQNTLNMASKCSDSFSIANVCLSLNINGNDDWFFPNAEELKGAGIQSNLHDNYLISSPFGASSSTETGPHTSIAVKKTSFTTTNAKINPCNICASYF